MENPEPYVAVPAINAISYTFSSDELIELYSNLLASSMISDVKWKVHPSFVEIIKQLSPDEAKMLKYLANNMEINEFPLVNLLMVKEDSIKHVESYISIRNFTNIANTVCDCPDNISSYIDNLVRLKIIEIRDYSRVSDCDYSRLHNDLFIQCFIQNNTLKEGFKWDFDDFLFMVTDFGKSFIDICVLEPKKIK